MDEEFLNEIWSQFELEAVEHSKNSEDILLESVNKNLSKDEIHKLFRNFHSLKGLTGSIGMSKTVALTHLAEDLISEIRKGTLEFCDTIRSALLQFIDTFNAVLKNSIKSRKETVPKNFITCKKELEHILKDIISEDSTTKLKANEKSVLNENPSDPISKDEEKFTQVSSTS